MTLSKTALNRALLARQFLLEPRAQRPCLDVLEQLVAVQAQQARPPFIGLWTRIAGFERSHLMDLLLARKVVRATLLRGTLHLASARDYKKIREALQPMLTAGMHSILRERAADLDLDRLLAAARKEFARAACTFSELREHLSGVFPGLDERAMGYAVRMHVPLSTAPDPAMTWAFSGDSPFELAGVVASTVTAGRSLVERYLAAFGPATPADFQAWSGMKNAKAMFEGLDLVRFRDEHKRELFDLPDAPIPDADTPAPPPCFLAAFDNIVLGHADRTRIIADEHRGRVVTKNLLVLPTFLVDGFVAGTWQTAVAKKAATLTIAPFEKVSKKVQKQLEEEGEKLVRFAEPEAGGYAVRFEG